MIFLISAVLASGFYARPCLAIDVGFDSTHPLHKSSLCGGNISSLAFVLTKLIDCYSIVLSGCG